MKNIVTVILLACMSTMLFAQAPKVQTAFFAMDAYKKDQKLTDKLEEAYEAIDMASKHESTSIKGKTWHYKGDICKMLYLDPTVTSKYPNALAEAGEAYQKAIELKKSGADPKFKKESEAADGLAQVTGQLYNDANTAYNGGSPEDLKRAYECFGSAMDYHKVLTDNGYDAQVDRLNISTELIYYYKVLTAERLGMKDEAKAGYEKLVAENFAEYRPYISLGIMYIEAKEYDKAMTVLKTAEQKFPEEAEPLIQQLNVFLAQDKEVEALDIINKAITLQPDRAVLYFVLANTLKKVGKEEEAIKNYELAIQKDPEYADAYNNLGAYYVDKANEMIEAQEKITGFSKADIAKTNELDAKKIEFYKQALPYLEKANELEPNELKFLDVLKTIYTRLKMYDKSKAVKEQMAKIQADNAQK